MKRIAIPLLLSLSLLLSGCQNTDTGSNGGDSASTGAESVAVIDTAALFSDRDLDGSYDESAAVHIQLEGETAVCDSDAVSIDGSRITLLDEGTYLVSGALTDGQIVVDAGDTDKVQIVLAGASLTWRRFRRHLFQERRQSVPHPGGGDGKHPDQRRQLYRHRQEQHRFRGVLQDRPDPQRFRQSNH